MAIGLPLISLLLTLAAPGDIYRCTDAAGKVGFQDHPCADASHSDRLATSGADSAASQRALQQWLEQHHEPDAPSSGATTTRQTLRAPFVGGPISEAQLAICSERFLHCAQGDAGAMDSCIGKLPRCGPDRGAACCPQACVSRYQALRRAGNELAMSVKLALLDPDAPACAAPL